MHDLLLIGHFVMFPFTAFSGVVVLWNRLNGIRNCITACIRSVDCMHKLPVLSSVIFDILPIVTALSIFYNLVCSEGCLSPPHQECGASMAVYAAESRQLTHASPVLQEWAPSELLLACSLPAILLYSISAPHDGGPWGRKDGSCCWKHKFPLFASQALLLLLALLGIFIFDGSGLPSIFSEVSMTDSLVAINTVHNTFNHFNAVSVALLLMGCIACTQSLVTCKILSVLSYLAFWLLLQSDFHCQAYFAIGWNPDDKALATACASLALRPSAQIAFLVLQQVPSILGITSCWALCKATAQLFQSHNLLPIYSHLGIDTRIHTALLSMKRKRIRLSHNDGKGQCFWRSVSHRQHAWQNAKQKALSLLLPCSRHAEARHRGQWASQVEIAAYAQASCAPITVLSTQQGKAFTFTPPTIKHPMLFILHERDHFQRVIYAAPSAFDVGEASEACFADIPLFPAPSETILPNLGSAVALWLGKASDGIYKADCLGPLGKSPDLTAGGPQAAGPFIPNPRAKAKPPPPHVYEAAGCTLSAWACDTYICKGIACIHGSPGPDYHCCAMDCETLSECPSSSDDDSSICFHTPRTTSSRPRTPEGEEIHIPQLDLFKGVPGYSILASLRSRANAFTRLAAIVFQIAANLELYSLHLPCGEHETRLWKSNAEYWNEACSYSEADIFALQNNAAKAAAESFVPREEPLYHDASSTYCPSFGENLPPGFLHQKQFRFLIELIQIRAHNAAQLTPPNKVEHSERLLVIAHAERFQRFAWQFFSHSDVATDEFAHQLYLDTIAHHQVPACSAGAEEDEDMPIFKPKRTRKRRPEETEARPARKQQAKDEADAAADHPPSPAPSANACSVKQERDVEMEQALPSQPPVCEERLPATPNAQEPIRRPGAPPTNPNKTSAPQLSTERSMPPTQETKVEHQAQQSNPPNAAPPPVRVQKAYPGKQPPPAASGEGENRPPTEPKPYKEMSRNPIPEACRPTSLPMPGFLTPPPKARPRTPGSTPRAAAKAPPATVYADVPKQPASSNPAPVQSPNYQTGCG